MGLYPSRPHVVPLFFQLIKKSASDGYSPEFFVRNESPASKSQRLGSSLPPEFAADADGFMDSRACLYANNVILGGVVGDIQLMGTGFGDKPFGGYFDKDGPLLLVYQDSNFIEPDKEEASYFNEAAQLMQEIVSCGEYSSGLVNHGFIYEEGWLAPSPLCATVFHKERVSLLADLAATILQIKEGISLPRFWGAAGFEGTVKQFGTAGLDHAWEIGSLAEPVLAIREFADKNTPESLNRFSHRAVDLALERISDVNCFYKIAMGDWGLLVGATQPQGLVVLYQKFIESLQIVG
jgi:hypothetical protein